MINLIYVNFNHLNDMLNVMKINLFINYCSKQQQFQIIKYQSIMLQLTRLSYTIEVSPNCFKWSVQLYNIYYDIDIYIYIYIIFFTDKLWIEFLNWKKNLELVGSRHYCSLVKLDLMMTTYPKKKIWWWLIN